MKTFQKISLIFLSTLLLTGCKNNYEKGVDNLKEKKYNESLEEFQKVNKDDENYIKAQSKINYIYGVLNYNNEEFEPAINQFTKVIKEDEFYNNSIDYIEKIKQNPSYIYSNGLNSLKIGWYDVALSEFQKIQPNEEIYKKTKPKFIFLNAINYQQNDKLDSALILLQTIEQTDEIYPDAQKLIASIKKEKEINEEKEYLSKVETIKSVKFGTDFSNADIIINGKRFNNYEKNDNFLKTVYKEIFSVNEKNLSEDGYIYLKFEDNRDVGVQKMIMDLTNYGGIHDVTHIINFHIDCEEFSIQIEDKNVLTKIYNNKSNYKFCFLYKIDDKLQEVEGLSKYAEDVYLKPHVIKFYILDKDNNIIYKIEKSID